MSNHSHLDASSNPRIQERHHGSPVLKDDPFWAVVKEFDPTGSPQEAMRQIKPPNGINMGRTTILKHEPQTQVFRSKMGQQEKKSTASHNAHSQHLSLPLNSQHMPPASPGARFYLKGEHIRVSTCYVLIQMWKPNLKILCTSMGSTLAGYFCMAEYLFGKSVSLNHICAPSILFLMNDILGLVLAQ